MGFALAGLQTILYPVVAKLPAASRVTSLVGSRSLSHGATDKVAGSGVHRPWVLDHPGHILVGCGYGPCGVSLLETFLAGLSDSVQAKMLVGISLVRLSCLRYTTKTGAQKAEGFDRLLC